MSLPTCLNYSWYQANNGYTLKGRFSSSEDVGAVAPVTGSDFTIYGLVSGSVYWLQVTSADENNSVKNNISLSGLLAVPGSTNYDREFHGGLLSGYYKVTGDPIINISGVYGDSVGFVSILVIEANMP